MAEVKTIDKVFDGEEGAIFWYSQVINNKVYPILVDEINSFSPPAGTNIFQIELHFPLIFFLFKSPNSFKGWLYAFHIERNQIFTTNDVIKFAVYESQGGRVLLFLKDTGTSRYRNKLYTVKLSDFNRSDFGFGNPSYVILNLESSEGVEDAEIYDLTENDGRIFLLVSNGQQTFIYFSQFMLQPHFPYFLESFPPPDQINYFTFPEYFTAMPTVGTAVLHKFLIFSQNGVYALRKKEIGGVLQYITEKILDVPIDFQKMSIQATQNFAFLSSQNKTYDVIKGETISNAFADPFFSNCAYPVLKNEIFSSILFYNDITKRKIDFSPDEKLFLMEDFLVRQDKEGKIFIYKLNSQGAKKLKGSLIFISHFEDYFHTKYVRKIKIRKFEDVWNIPQQIQEIPVPPFPYSPSSLITDEFHNVSDKWTQVRAVGKVFLFEIEPNGVLPILDVEYDLGK